jgi:hypothetical protein
VSAFNFHLIFTLFMECVPVKQHQTLIFILSNMPQVGRGEMCTSDVELALNRDGYKESNRTVRRYLAYLYNTNKITIVRTEGQRRFYARLKKTESSMSYEQALVLNKVKACITELFPKAVVDALVDWFKQAETTVTQLGQSNPNHPLLKYAQATKAMDVKALYSFNGQTLPSMAAANDAIYQDKELRVNLAGDKYERHIKPSAIKYRGGIAYLEGQYVDNPEHLASIPFENVKDASCVDYLAFRSKLLKKTG